ncbi:hypothetical protein F2Q68_00044776 [Brassica cretica]|uniref:Uncharacterized protein n=1 Tax=Brassica cretica TaxID=69181 RepID=A0A8S9LEN7_BRACR|nr:hypothetical protein F2Q68_00044776 [Brassica cretica]
MQSSPEMDQGWLTQTSSYLIGTLMIGGMETHVLFDTWDTHSFMSPDLVGKGLFCLNLGIIGGQVMHSLGLMKNIQGRNLPVDLIVVRLQNHEMILGMVLLGKYRATLDCHRGRVRLEIGPHPIQYQSLNLSPALRKVVVSAVRVDQMLRRGCEVFLTTTVGTEIRTVDFRQNKESQETLTFPENEFLRFLSRTVLMVTPIEVEQVLVRSDHERGNYGDGMKACWLIQLAEQASWTARSVQLVERASWTVHSVQLACSASWTVRSVQLALSASWTMVVSLFGIRLSKAWSNLSRRLFV